MTNYQRIITTFNTIKITKSYAKRLIELSEELANKLKKHPNIEINLSYDIYYLIDEIQALKVLLTK